MSAVIDLASAAKPLDLDAVQPRVLDISRWRKEAVALGDVQVEPYSAILGGWVRGLRLTSAPSQEVSRFLQAQLLERGFLAFEPGTVNPKTFNDLVGVFGQASYMGTPYTPVSQVTGGANTIDSRTKKTRANYIWHIDQAFRARPTRYTALFGEAVPSYGGDTVFSHATAAYDLLDPLFAKYLETLTAIQSYDAQGFLSYAYGHDPVKLAQQRELYPPVESPLIKVHPETGLKQIFVNELYTTRIVGLPPVVSQHLLGILFEIIKTPEVEVRFRWQDGVALIWDNRIVQHRGVLDFGDQRRLLHRAVVE
ncbi:MAG: taurine catabolism dioxygenase TauD [Curvibacter sp. PD_MW3]|nr:MAG: taurine catabolism dioxygenase TauD [Curvibacter sp. PD_MW3]